ncbi:MAG: DUF72 domain-containing protein [Planctomycetota bacterium]
MGEAAKFIVGTSGYSFADWVGTFYPPGTSKREMFEQYVRHFPTTELNFTYYRMPTTRTMESMVRRSPEGFDFWVKANQRTTHEGDRSAAPEFIDQLAPLREAGKLAGVLLQFPQSFHRSVASRKYLAACCEDFAELPLAVEFRHRSWDHPSTNKGLRARQIALVIPDVPPIPNLYRPAPTITAPIGYLRLHSRNGDLWYAGAAQRYDYDYSQREMQDLLTEWRQLAAQADRVYAFFNNCHRGQAAQNAETFRHILGQIE